jgi:hypothetical protein
VADECPEAAASGEIVEVGGGRVIFAGLDLRDIERVLSGLSIETGSE